MDGGLEDWWMVGWRISGWWAVGLVDGGLED